MEGLDVRSTSGARQSPDKVSQVRPVVGARHDQVRGTEVGELGKHVVERHESTGGRRAVVVPDLAVCRVGPDGRRTGRYQVILRVGRQVGLVREVGAAACPALLGGRRNDPDLCPVSARLYLRGTFW